MPSIPKNPCPLGGLVPWMQGVWPVTSRKPHPVLLWLYTIQEKAEHRPLCMHYNVSQEDVVNTMAAFAAYKIGEVVPVGPYHVRHIKARKWDFHRGTMFYLLEDRGGKGRPVAIEQEELQRRVHAATEEHA